MCSASTSRAPSSVRPDASAYFAEVSRREAKPTLDRHVAALKDDMRDLRLRDPRPRSLRSARAGASAATLIRAASPVAEAFCRSRLDARAHTTTAR